MKSSLFPIILGISLSYSQQVQDIVRDNTFTTKRQKVKSLLKNQNLSDKDRAALDELWNNAQRIGRLNDRCASISLNDVLDETCQTFYKVELPAFDELYGKVTNDIRMNGFSPVKAVQNGNGIPGGTSAGWCGIPLLVYVSGIRTRRSLLCRNWLPDTTKRIIILFA